MIFLSHSPYDFPPLIEGKSEPLRNPIRNLVAANPTVMVGMMAVDAQAAQIHVHVVSPVAFLSTR